MDEKEKLEWHRKHNEERERHRQEMAAKRKGMTFYSDRWNGRWFQVPGQGYPITYGDVVRQGLKQGANKRQIDESLDALVASGRIIVLDKSELDEYMEKDYAQLVEQVIKEAGPQGITEDEITEAVDKKLKERVNVTPPPQCEKPPRSYEERTPRTTMFKRLIASGVDGAEAAKQVREKYPPPEEME